MFKLKTGICLFIYSMLCCQLAAQLPVKECLADRFLINFQTQNPTAFDNWNFLQQQTNDWIRSHQFAAQQRDILIIPVVVHVVWNTDKENISDEQIISQFEVLNEDFRLQNEDRVDVPSKFQSRIADVGIEFCLATTDPLGKPTNGITRRFTSFENIAFKFDDEGKRRVKHENSGGIDAWNTQQYLNIWVCAGEDQIAGDATFPGQADVSEDGVVINHFYFGKTGTALENVPFDRGRTTTHEIAHYLNVQHIWGTSMNNCGTDDQVADTPTQASPYYGCPDAPVSSCGSEDMFMNYMNYVADDCMNSFTEGQKWRMLATLNGPRSTLLNSTACGNNAAGIQPIVNNRYTFYPNPASDILNVYLQSNDGLEYIELWSMDGTAFQKRFSFSEGTLHQIDLTPVPSGIYLLHVRKTGDSIYQKIVIQKHR